MPKKLTKTPNPPSPGPACSALTDAERLEWVIKHKATVVPGERMLTRRGGLAKENMEQVWQLEYVTDTGDLVMQTPDCGHKTFRAAIDAGMGDTPNSSISPKSTAQSSTQ